MRIAAICKNELKRLRTVLHHRLLVSPTVEKDIIDQFHKLYYDSQMFGGTWNNTRWLGVLTEKCPLDLWVYQEIIASLKPDVIIETGTSYGGSALYYASLCDMIDHGRIITIDIAARGKPPTHKRITYLQGSSTDVAMLERVRHEIQNEKNILVILDSDHSKTHVANELAAYAPLVTVGNYVIVEDTNVNGNPVYPEFGPGPMEALNEFLTTNNDFIVDTEREKFYLTFNPRGYLRRVR